MSLQSSVSGVVSGTALGHLMCLIDDWSCNDGATVIVFGEGCEPQALTLTLQEMGINVIGVDPAYPEVQPDDIHFPCYSKASHLRGLVADPWNMPRLSTERLIVVNLRSHALPRDVYEHVHSTSLDILDYPGCGGGLIPFSEDLVCAMPLEDGTVLRLKKYKGTLDEYTSKCLGEDL